MPNFVKDRVHSMARRANADNSLQFTDSEGNDLNAMYPDDDADDDNDADYDLAADKLSYESDEELDYHPTEEDEQSPVSIDHPADPEVTEGVGNTADTHDGNHSDSNRASNHSDSNRGSNSASNTRDSNRGSDDSDNSTPLTTNVDTLEAKLDAELADLDTIYDPAVTQATNLPIMT
jgi:hypothetical protein